MLVGNKTKHLKPRRLCKCITQVAWQSFTRIYNQDGIHIVDKERDHSDSNAVWSVFFSGVTRRKTDKEHGRIKYRECYGSPHSNER
jgi:hypothetical protein